MRIHHLLHVIRHPVKAYREHSKQEKVIHRKHGLDPDKTYYVIRCNLPECGLFAIYMYILDHLIYADDHGYTPVIDMEQYPCLYKEDTPVNGTTDPFLYYFEPISDVKLSDCKKFANVIYAPIRFLHYKAIYYYAQKEKNVLPDDERIEELYAVVSKYMRLNRATAEAVEKAVKVLGGYKRVLGIHVRGTDMYTQGKQHPVPDGKTKDFSVIDGIIAKDHIDGILLCTDTEQTIRLFREKYGDMLVTSSAIRQKDDSHTGLHKDQSLGMNRAQHKYKLGIEVIVDMILLSKCHILMFGPSNVPFVALINNHNMFEKVFYFA